jgi:excisionase family DNA binding protein
MKINEYMTIKEAAAFLGIKPYNLRRWEKSKKISSYRNPANNWRLYKKEDLEKWLADIKLAK